MNLTLKQKIIAVVVYTAVCVAGGRYSVTETITTDKTVVQTDTSTKKDTQKVNDDRDKHTHTIVVEKISKDCEKTITTDTTVDDVKHVVIVKNDTDTTKQKTDETEHTKVEKGGSKLTISALAGVNITNVGQGVIYGAHVQREFFGPVSCGVFGLSNGTVGASVGLSF